MSKRSNHGSNTQSFGLIEAVHFPRVSRKSSNANLTPAKELVLRWSSLSGISFISWVGRVALSLIPICLWVYIIYGTAKNTMEITHLTNWSLTLGLAFYTVVTLGTLFPPILKYGMLVLLFMYHAILYIVMIGILVIVAYNPTIFQEAIDKYGLSKVCELMFV